MTRTEREPEVWRDLPLSHVRRLVKFHEEQAATMREHLSCLIARAWLLKAEQDARATP